MTTGNFYYTDGLDMNSNPTIERVQLVKLLEGNDNFNCVILCSDGIRVMANLSELRETK
jgi:hypothetical protein